MKRILSRAGRICCVAAGAILLASACRASCPVNTYAHENYVVFYDCDSANQPRLNVVVLDDASPLRVAGQAPFSNSRGIDAFHIGNEKLTVLTWDLVEVYSLKDPAHPVRNGSWHIKNQGSFAGYPRIEEISADKLLLLASVGAAELDMTGAQSSWTLKDLPTSAETQKKMSDWPPERAYDFARDPAVTILETAKYRYELKWKFTNRPGEAISRQYLRRLAKAGGPVAELRLGERIETID